MSKPPRPHYEVSTTGTPSGKRAELDYLPREYAGFVKLQRELAEAELGLVSAGEEGDFARTTMEMSAVLAHLLAVYQDRHANEAFLGTAQSPRSLVRHGQRLGYEPDSGMAASGKLALTIAAGPGGVLPAGFAMRSVPQGEQSAQEYETIADLNVVDTHNTLDIKDALVPGTIAQGDVEVVLSGDGFGLEVGEKVVLAAWDYEHIDTIKAVEERDSHTYVTLTTGFGAGADGKSTADLTLMARPRTELRMFGWNADPESYDPSWIKTDGRYQMPANVGDTSHGYRIWADGVEITNSSSALYDKTILFDHALEEPLSGLIIQLLEGTWSVRRITAEHALTVSFKVGTLQAITVTGWYDGLGNVTWFEADGSAVTQSMYMKNGTWTQAMTFGAGSTKITDSKELGNNAILDFPAEYVQADDSLMVLLPDFIFDGGQVCISPTEPGPVFKADSLPVERSFSGSVTAFEATPAIDRKTLDPQTVWLAHFQVQAALAPEVPNDAELEELCALDTDTSELYPGQDLLFEDIEDGTVEEIQVVYADADTNKLSWTRSESDTHKWRKGYTRIWGNVAKITHGRTISAVLGSSDGTQPFLKFPLKKSPVTILATGPALEVRVGGVLWERVDDFWDSEPEDRHYVVERDQDAVTYVLFGDGRKGAIPPSGKRNIECVYRVGLGIDGNAEAGQVSRIIQAHPLVSEAINLLPIDGGSDPASAQDVRSQAATRIRTFGRAVSLSDHADYALLYSGVAKATAWWGTQTYASGARTVNVIHLAAATSDGSVVSEEGLRAHMKAGRDNQIPLVIKDVAPLEVALDLTVTFDHNYLEDDVKNNIRDALRGDDGLFVFKNRDLGQPAYLSEVYKALMDVVGVETVVIETFEPVGDNEAEPQDTIRCERFQWLALPAGQPTFGGVP